MREMLAAPPIITRYDLVLAGGWEFRDVRNLSDMRPPVHARLKPETGGYTIEIP